MTAQEIEELQKVIRSWLEERDLLNQTQSIKVSITERPALVVLEVTQEKKNRRTYTASQRPLEEENWEELLGVLNPKLRVVVEFFRENNNDVHEDQLPPGFVRTIGALKIFRFTSMNTTFVRHNKVGSLKYRYQFVKKNGPRYKLAICELKTS